MAAAEDKVGIDRDRVQVKRYSGVATWSWDIEIDTCAICRNSLQDICIECQANITNSALPSQRCNIAWGVCNHAFHFHCITRWLQRRNTCPLDNTDWDLQKYGD